MEATLTSKGQLTLPKPARDSLGLVAGAVLTVRVTKAGAITLTPVVTNPLSIAGLLKERPSRRKAVSPSDADPVGAHLADMDERIKTTGRSLSPGDR